MTQGNEAMEDLTAIRKLTRRVPLPGPPVQFMHLPRMQYNALLIEYDARYNASNVETYARGCDGRHVT